MLRGACLFARVRLVAWRVHLCCPRQPRLLGSRVGESYRATSAVRRGVLVVVLTQRVEVD